MKFTDEQIAQTQKVVDTLNMAFENDQQALYHLMINHVQCNKALADHPTIEVGKIPVLNKPDAYRVGTIGCINGVLSALGLPRVCVIFEDGETPESPKKFHGVAILQEDVK